jgi:hypothetical protein
MNSGDPVYDPVHDCASPPAERAIIGGDDFTLRELRKGARRPLSFASAAGRAGSLARKNFLVATVP